MTVAIGDYTLTSQRVNQILETLGGDMTELFAIAAEVENARDGLTTLLAQVNALQASITALAVGSGCPVSLDDTSAGVLDGKLVMGTGMAKDIGSPAGNETMILETQDEMAIFAMFAF